jgi:hypothetical protein
MTLSKFFTGLSLTAFAAGSMIPATVSAANTDHEPAVNMLLLKGNLNGSQAKDAMALNGIYYYILYSLTSTLESTDAATQTPITPGIYNCTDGKDENGTYTVTREDGVITYEFGTSPGGICWDENNSNDLQGELLKACLLNAILPMADTPPTSGEESTYTVRYTGKVTCSDLTAQLDNYTVTATGGGARENKWSYDGVFTLTHNDDKFTLGLDATVHGQYWDSEDHSDENLINDELWIMDKFALSLERGDTASTISADGSASYLGAIRQGDEENNGLALSISFNNMSYTTTPLIEDDKEIPFRE